MSTPSHSSGLLLGAQPLELVEDVPAEDEVPDVVPVLVDADDVVEVVACPLDDDVADDVALPLVTAEPEDEALLDTAPDEEADEVPPDAEDEPDELLADDEDDPDDDAEPDEVLPDDEALPDDELEMALELEVPPEEVLELLDGSPLQAVTSRARSAGSGRETERKEAAMNDPRGGRPRVVGARGRLQAFSRRGRKHQGRVPG
ncbi:MAG: hypothetical protein AB2A00_38945 [Myxococcota bacterium]